MIATDDRYELDEPDGHVPADASIADGVGPDLDLFRRAIVGRDDRAWATIYYRCLPFVQGWLGPGHADDAVAEVFERFWSAIDADKFARFDTLGSILRYLKLCAASVRVDRGRAARTRACEHPLDDAAHEMPAPGNVAEQVAGRVDAAELWRLVHACVTGEREGRILYLSYVVGLSPRQICAFERAAFPDVAEVYQIKRTALDRLRRCPDLRAYRAALPVAV